VNDAECSGTTEFEITYFPPINAIVQASQYNICMGETQELQAGGGLFYSWSDPNGSLSATDIANPIASPEETTNYRVETSDNCPNNVAELEVNVIVNGMPDADAGLDTCAIAGIGFELEASGGESYSWDNTSLIEGSSNVSNPTIVIDSATTFTVTVTDENGCVGTDLVNVCVIDDVLEILEAVTLITPNGDGDNDELVFRGLEAFTDNELTIFNRWGAVIFKKRAYQNDAIRWSGTRDGVELPADTYYYVLEFNGQTIKKSITILRD